MLPKKKVLAKQLHQWSPSCMPLQGELDSPVSSEELTKMIGYFNDDPKSGRDEIGVIPDVLLDEVPE